MWCHLICVYIKLQNGFLLTVYISKGLKDYIMYTIYIHSMLCQKGQKIMLCTQYRYIQCYVERAERLCYVETRHIHIFPHNFLNIQPIFNPKKVLES